MYVDDGPDDAPTAVGLEEDDDAPSYGDKKTKKGPLLAKYKPGSAEEKKLATLHLALWEAQDPVLDKPTAQWGVNAARRAGISNAKLLYRRSSETDLHWTAWMPKHATPDLTPDVNKAATLCRRMTSQMYIDPWVAEVAVPDGDDDDRDAAELSQRVLASLQDEHYLNEPIKQRRSFDRSHTYGSGYIEYMVDQRGGGQRAVKVEARADALNAQLALVDPLTGEQGPVMKIGPDGMPQPQPFVERFVDERGDFVDTADDAAVQYIPALKSQVLDSRHVRLLPHTAADIWEAEAAMIASLPTWGQVKLLVPGIESQLDEETIEKMLSFRPSFASVLVAESDDVPELKVKGKWNDQRRTFLLKSYHLRCPEYPRGLMLMTIGGCYVLHRSDWVDDSDGEVRPLSIPLTQHCGFDEGREGYWKVGLMELVGPGNEARAAHVASLLDHLERFGQRKTYLPTNSIINPDQIRNPQATILPMNPGGQPIHEDIPDYPQDSYIMYEESGRTMDEASGLRETSGPNSKSNVKSGRHEFALVAQVHAGLAEPRQNSERAFLRSGRITLELARAFLSDEQQTKWAPEGGEYRMLAWKGADLVTEPAVRVKAGSGTMLAPAAKAQLAERYAGTGVIDADDLKDVITSNIGPQIGIQDNPHRMRVRSQISKWKEGPPEGWQPQTDPQTGQPPIDPMTGQPVMDPVLQQLFAPTLADTLPPVAAMRLKELADAMAGPKYQRLPPEWRMGLDLEFQRMSMALSAMQGQAAGDEPARDPDTVEEDDETGLANKDGTGLNDLQEDALQEGAPPEMVL